MLLTEELKEYELVLVSQSPRRRELLEGLEIDFSSTSVDIYETYPETLSGAQIPMYIAEAKASAYEPKLNNSTIAITADTVVLLGNDILEKPEDAEKAKDMLRRLSGNTHKVITGFAYLMEQKRSFHAISDVTFATLTDEEIDHYVEVYNPFDKQAHMVCKNGRLHWHRENSWFLL